MDFTAGIILITVMVIGTGYILGQRPRCRKFAISMVLIAVLLVSGCSGQFFGGKGQPDGNETGLEVHFIDVGQGDSILIKNGDRVMIIDSGTRNNSVKLKKYLDGQGISRFEYVVATNPLKDHTGGIGDLIENYKLNWIIIPRIDGLNENYKDLQMRLLARYIKPVIAEPGQCYSLGDASFTILAPNGSYYNDLADYSVVIKLEYGETSFLFSSDAGRVSEQEMLDMEFDLSANVLKLGRHGSSAATSDEFLQAVSPDTAVLSVGKDNPYLHPHMQTMIKLHDRNIPVYRTDEQGAIVAVSDGRNITFKAEPGSYSWPEMAIKTAEEAPVDSITEEDPQKPVLVNENSNKYHAAGCSFLDEKCIEITLEQARESGYEPCLLCKP